LRLECGWLLQQLLLLCRCCRLLILTCRTMLLLLPAAGLAAACHSGWLLCFLEGAFLQVSLFKQVPGSAAQAACV
jgi:hypothetical protein